VQQQKKCTHEYFAPSSIPGTFSVSHIMTNKQTQAEKNNLWIEHVFKKGRFLKQKQTA
jgi:hypothetical protein